MPTELLNIGDSFTATGVDEELDLIVHDFIVDLDGNVWVIGINKTDGFPWALSEEDVDSKVNHIQRVPNLNTKKKGKK